MSHSRKALKRPLIAYGGGFSLGRSLLEHVSYVLQRLDKRPYTLP